MTIQYREVLNPAQYEAVMHGEGPALIIAGAGSGKTRTLVYRVARLVDSGVHPASILLLTFTRRASEEMLNRAAELLDSRCGLVRGGTFHSTANKVLRTFGPEIGIPQDFTILDRSDSEDIISWLRKELELHRRELHFPTKSTLMDLFSAEVNLSRPLDEIVTRRAKHFDRFMEDIMRVRDRYTEFKRQDHLLDYDDLLVFFRTLLQEAEWVRQAVNQRHSHILVDEFQDTNPIQNDLVTLLAGPEKNLVVVGDDCQSIYSFRGARFKNIIEFPLRFPEARIIKLEENYRSTQPVLDAANRIMSEAREKYTKCLFTRRGQGPSPTIWCADSEHQQTLLVAREISDLLEQGYLPEEIAVLFRGSQHSYDLEVELANRELPFVKYGGLKFLEAAHIKDVMAHLRVLANPRDFYSWQRVLMLLEGVGPKRAQKIIGHLKQEQRNHEGLSDFPKADSISGLKDLSKLFEDLSNIRGNPRMQLESTFEYYRPILQDKYDDHHKRVGHLEALLNVAARFSNLREFLSEVTLEPPRTDAPKNRISDSLTLSTVHSAKGLEWRAVFVIWVAEGWFPHARVMEDSEEMEEERRLLYVAVTRAKDRLYLTYPRFAYRPGEGLITVEPSRFLHPLRPCAATQSAPPADKPAAPASVDLERLRGNAVSRKSNGPLRGLRTGRKVRHPSLGSGVVIGMQGEGRVMIQFENTGLTTLELDYAPIELLD
jgi:DNA helicase-2/ATP-dependent DNA helicase PcrA